MQFGDILRHLIEENNLTQRQLGLELNIAPTTIGNYVRNIREPDYETLKIIAAYFNVSTDYLLDRNRDSGSSPEEDLLLNLYRGLNDEYKSVLVDHAKTLSKHQSNK